MDRRVRPGPSLHVFLFQMAHGQQDSEVKDAAAAGHVLVRALRQKVTGIHDR